MTLTRGKIHRITPPPKAVLKSPNTSVGVVRIGKQSKYGAHKGMKPPGSIRTTKGTTS